MLMITACNHKDIFPKIVVEYPKTEKDTVYDEYFGTSIADPYRWLEDNLSKKTSDWVQLENAVTNEYIKKIPFHNQVRERMSKLANFERYEIPFVKSGKYYYFKNSGLQNQSVLYVTQSKDQEGKVLIDPNTFSKDGTISIDIIEFSLDGKKIAYSISESGSDWQKIVTVDSDSGKVIDDTIQDVKFSPIVWNKNDGFFYSKYDKPSEGSKLSGITMYHKVFYHKTGTPQQSDQIIFGNGKLERRYVTPELFESSKYLFISAAEGTSGNELYFRETSFSKNDFKPIVSNFDNDHFVVYAKDDDFYILTNLEAPNKRLVKGNINNPEPENWKEIIPEKSEVIESTSFAGGFFFVQYLKDAVSIICQYDLDGKLIRQVQLPSIGFAEGFSGEEKDTEVFFSFESFTVPASMYSYNIETGKADLFKSPKLATNLDDYITTQVFYPSKDGTKIPMFIVHKKDITLNGKNPTLLYGYGGFNISFSPTFSMRWLMWMDMGGVFALANIRGGGEYGEAWHEAGTKLKKQNVFDDFIAAAEFLEEKKYTSPEKLTIMGGSNGGLLVGAVMTQRPELIKVALPAVGVMDMLRFHKFTAGAGWISDYGCADSSEVMFKNLLGYSPVQNVRAGVSYPATLVTTADHDDRVVPAHSFKFIAHLQAKQAGELPVLIRIETKAGHGAGKSTNMFLDELADLFSFAFYNMNETPAYYKK